MFDISHFVESHFDYFTHDGKDYHVNCIKCDDSKQHLYISIVKPVVHCFRCGYSATWIQCVIDATGYPYWRAFGEVYVKPRMVDFDSKLASKTKNPNIKVMKHEYEVPEDFVQLTIADSEVSRYARRYMKDRGFGRWYWDRYELGLADSVPNRVIIPIDNGYWQGRKLFDWMEPKYINPKEPGRDVLFNHCALERYDEIAVTEGAFSAMAIGENAIALIRKDPTIEQIDRILGCGAGKFIVALEPDAYGTMQKLIQALDRNGKEVIVWKYDVGDPADPNGKMIQMEYSVRTHVNLMLNS